MARSADRIGGALWMAFGLAMAVGAWNMDRFESMGANVYSAPGLVPGIYGALLFLLGAVLAGRKPRQASSDAGSDPSPEASPDAAASPLLNRRVGWMLVLALAYAALAVGRAPFGLSTAIFVAAFCWLFDDQPSQARRLTTAVVAGALTAVVVVLVFERIFLVRLP